MELKLILESILFTSQQPLTPKELKQLLNATADHSEDPGVKAIRKSSLNAINTALEELLADHDQPGRSYRLGCVAGAWQFVTLPEDAPWIKELVGHKSRPPRLSNPALETLAIISYRQPLTRSEIEQVRGVAVDGVMQTLLDRGLIEQVGRAELPGRPITYGTTPLFLEYFGLRNLEELPAADELRRIVIEKPESLFTADPGLATAGDDESEAAGQNGPQEASAEARPDAPEPEGAPSSQGDPEAEPLENSK